MATEQPGPTPHARPFRFGVNARTASSAREWVELARKVEDQGYDVLLLPDHLDECFAPIPALVAAAAATERLRVGTFVVNNDLRHPVLLAREAAVADLLSDGRFELGIGAGHMGAEYDQAGIPFEPLATRTARLAEAVAIITGLLEGREVRFEGEHHHVRAHRIHPLPAQRPRPPLLIGGGSRGVLELAARTAEIVGFTGLATPRRGAAVDVGGFRPEAVDRSVALVRAAAGERAAALEHNVLVQVVDPDPDRRAAAERIAGRLPALHPDDALATPFLLLGTPEDQAEQLRRQRDRWGISYVATHGTYGDAMAPVVARLAGT